MRYPDFWFEYSGSSRPCVSTARVCFRKVQKKVWENRISKWSVKIDFEWILRQKNVINKQLMVTVSYGNAISSQVIRYPDIWFEYSGSSRPSLSTARVCFRKVQKKVWENQILKWSARTHFEWILSLARYLNSFWKKVVTFLIDANISQNLLKTLPYEF